MEQIPEYLFIAVLLYLVFKIMSIKYRPFKSSVVFVIIGLLIYYVYKKYMSYNKEGFMISDNTESKNANDSKNSNDSKNANDSKKFKNKNSKENNENSEEEQNKIEENKSQKQTRMFRKIINLILDNLNNKEVLDKIKEDITKIETKERHYYELGYSLSMSNPSLVKNLVSQGIEKLIAVLDISMQSKELKNLLTLKNEMIEKKNLEKKIEKLENVMNEFMHSQGLTGDGFVDKLVEQGRYIDKTGFVREIPKGDMKYNEMDPRLMERRITPEDDKWSITNFGTIDFERWRPPKINLDETVRHPGDQNGCMCPTFPQGYPTYVWDFDRARHIMPADNINIPYIKKLNTTDKYK